MAPCDSPGNSRSVTDRPGLAARIAASRVVAPAVGQGRRAGAAQHFGAAGHQVQGWRAVAEIPASDARRIM